MILLIIDIIVLIIAVIFFFAAIKIKIDKDSQQEEYRDKLKTEVLHLIETKNNLTNSQLQSQEEIDKKLQKWKEQREQQVEQYYKIKKDKLDIQFQQQQKLMHDAIAQSNQEFQVHKQIIQQQKDELNQEIETLRASLSAGVEARLREQEKKDKLNFYKLSISDSDLSDVKKLENLKSSFHKPVVLSKLIWTQYFQKQMTQLCDRVLGKKTVCGIYKITDLTTEQCYIGQSVDVSKRWKDHCKCGLGIQASATNKLYNAMQKDGVWNFTFELLEQCSRELLNEKEKFWIQMYQSNKFGLNTTKGNL